MSDQADNPEQVFGPRTRNHTRSSDLVPSLSNPEDPLGKITAMVKSVPMPDMEWPDSVAPEGSPELHAQDTPPDDTTTSHMDPGRVWNTSNQGAKCDMNSIRQAVRELLAHPTLFPDALSSFLQSKC